MGLFSRTPPRPPADAIVDEMVEKPPLGMWADGFGRLSTRSLQALIVLGIATLLFIGLRSVTVVTIPVLLALIFASAFAPAMGWMRRRGVPSALATVITLLAILLILGGVGWLIVWAVRDQWDELYTQGEEGFQTLLVWVQGLPFAPTDDQIEGARTAIIDFVTSAQFGSGALRGVSAVGNFLAGFVLLVTVLYFFLKDGPRMWEFLLRPFEGEGYARGKRIGERTVSTFGSYLRGTALVALVDAVGIGIGLLILQVPLALPLVVLTFVLSFIPIVGAVLAGAIAALVALVALGPVQALIVVGIVVLVQQLESNILQPFLMGRTMRLQRLRGADRAGRRHRPRRHPRRDPGGAAHGRGVGRRAGVGRPRHPRPLGATEAPRGRGPRYAPDRVAQRSLDRPKAERAAQPKGA